MSSEPDVHERPRPRLGGSGWTQHTAVAWSLAILSLVTAVIHFAVAGADFQEYWLYGVFMLGAAWLQLAFALGAALRPSRLLWWAGAALNTAVITVYVVTRVVGDVVGPAPHTVEPVGFGDLSCTVLEGIVVLGCVWLLCSTHERVVDRRRVLAASGAVGVAAAAILSVALVAGGPEMVMSMDARPASAAAADAAPVSLSTRSPAGAVTMPDPTMQMGPGMRMASSTACTRPPTEQQQRAAVALVDASWSGAERFRSLAAAEAAGYVPLTPSGLKVVHYIDKASYEATLAGGPVLDTAEPQSLVYANTPHGAVLVAAMYLSAPGGSVPDPGGCLTQWHVHTNLCITPTIGVVGAVGALRASCPSGSENRVTPPMLHVWFVPIPGGPLAVDAPNAAVLAAAEQVPAPPNARA